MAKYNTGFRVDKEGGAGNAYTIMSQTIKLLQAKNAPQSEIDSYKKAVMRGDYDNLVALTKQLVDLELY